jgi:hypothetical protein
MAVDLDAKTTQELETIVANCQRLGGTGQPICLDAARILDAHRNGDYGMDKPVAAIRDYDRQSRFLSYKDVANASGHEWTSVFRQISPHLDAVCICHGNEWPLPTAIVVDEGNRVSGEMIAANRKGFLGAARGAGRHVDIEQTEFVKREQQRVFDWCRVEH